MIIAMASATWDRGILNYYGSTVTTSNVTNTDTVNHIDILNTSLKE